MSHAEIYLVCKGAGKLPANLVGLNSGSVEPGTSATVPCHGCPMGQGWVTVQDSPYHNMAFTDWLPDRKEE